MVDKRRLSALLPPSVEECDAELGQSQLFASTAHTVQHSQHIFFSIDLTVLTLNYISVTHVIVKMKSMYIDIRTRLTI